MAIFSSVQTQNEKRQRPQQGWHFAVLILCIVMWPIGRSLAANSLPDIGTAGLSVMSLEKERIIGDAYMRQIRGSYPVLNDPTLSEYMETIGNKLLTATRDPLQPFTFFMLHDNTINAFAFFGGYVGVHTGLFLKADNESQLASVLSHEMAHVNQRHLARSLEQQANASPATLLSALGSIVLAMIAPEAGMAALQTSLGVSRQMSINYTRQNEAEADRMGMQNMVRAGFDPNAFPAFFEKLAAESRYASKPPAFLLSHPLPQARIADMRLRAQQYKPRHVPININFQFAKARVEARYGPRSTNDPIAFFKHKLTHHNYVSEDGVRYGLALAYLDNGHAKQALAEITPLMKKYQDNLFLIDAITDIDMALGEAQKSLNRLARYYQYMPDNQVIAINYGNILMKTDHTEQAIKVLRDFSYSHQDNTLVLSMLEDAYGKTGNLARQYTIRAERLALAGGFDRAIQQLMVARRYLHKGDEVQESRIDARIHQYQQIKARLQAL